MDKAEFRLISNGGALVIATALLTSLGLIAIYASSAMKGAEQFGDPYFFVRKQFVVALAGFGLIAMIRYLPMKWIESVPLPAIVGAVILLLLIFVPGLYTKVGGANRWLNLGFLRFQTSEIAKIALVFFLAKNISRPGCNLKRLGPDTLSNLLVFGVVAALLMVQPDFGSTVLLAVVSFAMMFVAGLGIKMVLTTIGLGIAAGAIAIVAEPYRVKRLLSFVDPWSEISSGGFQIIQSYLGFQNGGLLGVGLGESKQKLFFLPEAHTDFILSVIGEELGLLGVVLVFALFAYIVALGLWISARQDKIFQCLIGFGFTVLLGIQAVMNLGVVMGLLPTKGIPLPFVSNGATSLITSLTMIGIIAKLDADRSETAGNPWRNNVFR